MGRELGRVRKRRRDKCETGDSKVTFHEAAAEVTAKRQMATCREAPEETRLGARNRDTFHTLPL